MIKNVGIMDLLSLVHGPLKI